MTSSPDPTKTTTLRKKFIAAIRSRIVLLSKDLSRLIEDDTLNLSGNAFTFETDSAKVEEFRKWLASNTDRRLVGVTTEQLEESFWWQYIEEGYRKGAGNVFDTLKKKGLKKVSAEFFQGARSEALRGFFTQPVSVERVKQLAGRVWDGMRGISDDLKPKLTRTLTDGLVEGLSPRQVGTNLKKQLQITKRRGDTIARTETIRAHAEGQLDMLEHMGVKEVGVMVEWSTTGDDRVCPLCHPMENATFTIQKARGMLPRHPNCRCSFIPANIGESAKVKTADEVQRQIDRSVIAEIPKKDLLTVSAEEQKAKSRWQGATKKPSRRRPKPRKIKR